MKPGSMAMLKMLEKPPKKQAKLPTPAAPPALALPPPGATPNAVKPVNDPTDPEQLLESERTPLGKKPSARIPVHTMLPKVPYKTKG